MALLGFLSLFTLVLVFQYSSSLSIFGGVQQINLREDTLQEFERRGLKRSAELQAVDPRERVVKPLPWEWDLHYITNHRPSHPAVDFTWPDPSTTVPAKELMEVESLDDLMKQYAALHARILRGQQAQRFVVFIANPEFGYGNKIQVLVSAFVFALMSERAILIDWPESRDVVILHRHTMKGISPLVTNIDHRELLEPPYGIQWHLTPNLRTRFYNDIKKSTARRFTNFTTVGVCEDLHEWEYDTQWAYIKDWDFTATLLLNNAHHRNINRLLVPFHDQLLYVLANALRIIYPTRDLKQETEAMRDRLFGAYRNEGILGIHMRTTHPDIPFDNQLVTQMVRCGLASGYKVWYVATESKEWRDRFSEVLHQLDPTWRPGGEDVDWSGGIGAKKREGIKLLWLDANITERNTIEGTRHALHEMLLLMACDDFMTLWGTTFGRLVASIGGFKEPIVVMKHQKLCVRKLTSEPCVYQWDKLKSAPCYQQSMQLPHVLYSSDEICREF